MLVTLLTCVLAGQATASAPVELLTNPGFDTPAAADGVAPGWSFGRGRDGVTATYLPRRDGAGGQTVAIHAVPPGDAVTFGQVLPPQPAGLYRFSITLSTPTGAGGWLYLRQANPPYAVYGQSYVGPPKDKTGTSTNHVRLPAGEGPLHLELAISDLSTFTIHAASVQAVDEAALPPADLAAINRAIGPPMPLLDEAKLVAESDARIRATRTAPLTVRVLDAAGQPVTGAEVQVEHTRHLFQFGAAFDRQLLPQTNEAEVDRRHRAAFLHLFNAATVRLYWFETEPADGQFDDLTPLKVIAWLKSNGLTPRGHPVFWNDRLPRWLQGQAVDGPRLRALMERRLVQLAAHVLPQLADADVFNELVHWERFPNALSDLMRSDGKIPLVSHFLKRFRELAPTCKIVVNDFDSSPQNYALLTELLATGAPIDIIGLQSHMHRGNWTPGLVWTAISRLALLQRPIVFTELTVVSGPPMVFNWTDPVPGWSTEPRYEQVQADYLEMLFKLIYSHPATAGIFIWSYSDRGAWKQVPCGLLYADGTPKQAYRKLDGLINHAWRTRGTVTTGPDGTATVPAAFEGHYVLTARGARVEGDHTRATPLAATVRLPAAP